MKLNELKRITQESRGKGKEALDVRLVYRKISLLLTRMLIETPITANQITIIMFFLGIISATCFILGYFWWGFGIIILSIVLDYCDGEVARYRNSSSKAGSFMDNVYHWTSMPLILIFSSGYFFQQTNNPSFIYLGVISAIFFLFGVSARISYFNILNKMQIPGENFVSKDNFIKRVIRRITFYEYYTAIIYVLIIGYILNVFLWVLAIAATYLGVKFVLQIILLYLDLNQVKTSGLRK
jgi:phosphatidylglycerophosphate synthase